MKGKYAREMFAASSSRDGGRTHKNEEARYLADAGHSYSLFLFHEMSHCLFRSLANPARPKPRRSNVAGSGTDKGSAPPMEK